MIVLNSPVKSGPVKRVIVSSEKNNETIAV